MTTAVHGGNKMWVYINTQGRMISLSHVTAFVELGQALQEVGVDISGHASALWQR